MVLPPWSNDGSMAMEQWFQGDGTMVPRRWNNENVSLRFVTDPERSSISSWQVVGLALIGWYGAKVLFEFQSWQNGVILGVIKCTIYLNSYVSLPFLDSKSGLIQRLTRRKLTAKWSILHPNYIQIKSKLHHCTFNCTLITSCI